LFQSCVWLAAALAFWLGLPTVECACPSAAKPSDKADVVARCEMPCCQGGEGTCCCCGSGASPDQKQNGQKPARAVCAKNVSTVSPPTLPQGTQVQDLASALVVSLETLLIGANHANAQPIDIDAGPPIDRIIAYRHLLI